MRKAGNKWSDIASSVGVSKSTAERTYCQMRINPDPYIKKHGGGPKRLLDERDLRKADRAIKSGVCDDAADVRRELFPHVSAATVRRRMAEYGLNGRVRAKKPLLTKKHMKNRRSWVEKFQAWQPEDWESVIFSDESQYFVVSPKRKIYCRRRVNERFLARNVQKTVKHGGGGIMVWGCITSQGPGRLVRIDGIMNAVQYINILKKGLLDTLKDYNLDVGEFWFQQDGDPKHTSGRAMDWFEQKGIDVLLWTGQSADMSIIEPAWDHIEQKLRNRNPLCRNKEELWVALQEDWYSMDKEYIKALYASMPCRLAALKKAKGSYTKY